LAVVLTAATNVMTDHQKAEKYFTLWRNSLRAKAQFK
jgi:hypothetical protein